MKDNYTYPAIVVENEVGGKDITFPDFDNAITCATKDEEIVEMAQDYLVLLIDEYETTGKELPKPGASDYEMKEGMSLIYINVWMPYHRTKIKEVYVKKTLTIPLWLDILAKKNDVNFSATLVKGLKEELGLKNR
jgi:predicted RNase H-like HicB family nuclease